MLCCLLFYSFVLCGEMWFLGMIVVVLVMIRLVLLEVNGVRCL